MNSLVQAIDPVLTACSWAQLRKHENAENTVRLGALIDLVQGKLKGCCQSADFSFSSLADFLTGKMPPYSEKEEDISWQRYSLFQRFVMSTSVLFERIGDVQAATAVKSLLRQHQSDQPGFRLGKNSHLNRQVFNFASRAYNQRRVPIGLLQAIRNYLAHEGPVIGVESILLPHPLEADKIAISQFSKGFVEAMAKCLFDGRVVKAPSEMLTELNIGPEESLGVISQILFEAAVEYVHETCRGIAVVAPGLMYA